MDIRSKDEINFSAILKTHLHLIRQDDNTILPDVILQCGGQTFRAHKLMLCINSRYFHSFFTNNSKSIGKMIISEVTAEVLSIMLNYFYTGNWQTEFLSQDNWMAINEAMNQFDCFQCGEREWEMTFNELAKCYYFDLWTLAIIYCRKDIETYVIEFVAKNLSQCMKDKKLLSLSLNQIIAILSHEAVTFYDEDTVAAVIRKWINHDTTRNKFASSLFNFAHISVEKKDKLISELNLSPIKITSPSMQSIDSPKEDCVVFSGTKQKWSVLLKQAMEMPLSVENAMSPLQVHVVDCGKTDADSPLSDELALKGNVTAKCSQTLLDSYREDDESDDNQYALKEDRGCNAKLRNIRKALSFSSCFEMMKSKSLSKQAEDTLILKSQKNGKIVVVDIGPKGASSIDDIKFTSSSEENVTNEMDPFFDDNQHYEKNEEVDSNFLNNCSNKDDATFTLTNGSSLITDQSDFSFGSHGRSSNSHEDVTSNAFKENSKSESNLKSITAKSTAITNSFAVLKKRLQHTISNSKMKLTEKSQSHLDNEVKPVIMSETKKSVYKDKLNKNEKSETALNCGRTFNTSETDILTSTLGNKSKIAGFSDEIFPAHEISDISEKKDFSSTTLKKLKSFIQHPLHISPSKSFFNSSENKSISSDVNSSQDWCHQNSSYVIDLSIFHVEPEEKSNTTSPVPYYLEAEAKRNIREPMSKDSTKFFNTDDIHIIPHSSHSATRSKDKPDFRELNMLFTQLRENKMALNNTEKSYLMKLCFEHKKNACKNISESNDFNRNEKSASDSAIDNSKISVQYRTKKKRFDCEKKRIPPFVHYRLKRKNISRQLIAFSNEDPLLVFLMEDHNGMPFRQIYNLKTNKWCSQHFPLIVPEQQRNYSLVYNEDKIYFIGGKQKVDYHFLHSVFVYDCKTNSLQQLPDCILARVNTSIVVLNDTLYIIGGLSVFDKPLSLGEYFNSPAENWNLISPMHFPRAGASAVNDTKYIYVMGGTDSSSEESSFTTLTSCERYDPALDQWTLLANIPSYFLDTIILTAVVTQRIVAIKKENPNKIYEYIVSTNEWIHLTDVFSPPKNVDLILSAGNKLCAFQRDFKTVYSLQFPFSEWVSETDVPLKLHWRGYAYSIIPEQD